MQVGRRVDLRRAARCRAVRWSWSRRARRPAHRPRARPPVTGCRASRAASASRSATSQAATVTSAPRPVSSATRSWAPGLAGPRRLTSSKRGTPRVTRCRATVAPSPLVPPVTRTVPSGMTDSVSSGDRRVRRGTNAAPLRTATCGSSTASASGSDSGDVEVGEGEPVGVLGLRGAHQPPHGRAREVGDLVAHRAPGRDHQSGGGEPRVGEPGLQQRQHLVRRRVGLGGGERVDDHRWHVVGRARRRRPTRPAAPRSPSRAVHSRPNSGCCSPGQPPQRGEVDRPDHQRPHGHHGCARRVGHLHLDTVGAGRRESDPGRRGAGRVQGDAAPGERQLASLGLVAVDEHAVQRGVEQRRVHAEPGRVRVGGLGQLQLGVHLGRPCTPRAAQALERRPVAEAGRREVVVETVDVDRRAPAGGHSVSANPASSPGATVPVACWVQGASLFWPGSGW